MCLALSLSISVSLSLSPARAVPFSPSSFVSISVSSVRLDFACPTTPGDRALNDCQSNNTKAAPYNFLYGKWEISAKMPPGHFWTALWLMPDADICWPKGGEVDILESDIWGQQPPYEPHAAYHWAHQSDQCSHDASDNKDGAAERSPKGYNFSQAFHTYSAELTPRTITFAVDGVPYYSVTAADAETNLPHTPLYLIMGNQLWGGWDYPTELPADFEIDWVKAWVPNPVPPATRPGVEV